MEGIPGVPGGGESARELAAPVLRLSRLGFFLAFRAGGLMNDGEDGSEVWNASMVGLRLRAKLLIFLGFLGPGDVMGRSSCSSRGEVASAIFRLWKESNPKFEEENEDKGTNVIGDSGDELGEGSESEEESTVDIVVVGEESVESEACVDVLSRCWCVWMWE